MGAGADLVVDAKFYAHHALAGFQLDRVLHRVRRSVISWLAPREVAA